jgi:hypothetical protein
MSSGRSSIARFFHDANVDFDLGAHLCGRYPADLTIVKSQDPGQSRHLLYTASWAHIQLCFRYG